jgi:hypothetical protein
LLVGLPLLVAALSVLRPTPLPRSFQPAFDGQAAKALASDLATEYPDRSPGSLAAAEWFREQLQQYGLRVRTEPFTAVIPGRGRVELRNLYAEAVGRSPRTIVVMAHRDNDGRGPGANDNASGTAMLIQLARAYATPPGVPATALHPNHTIVFLSTDGGAFGGLGAAWFAEHSPVRHDVAAVINLDAVGGRGRLRLLFNGDVPRTPSGTMLETVAARAAAESGRTPARPGFVAQLVDLGFPLSLHEQAPFLAQRIGAVTLTTAEDPPDPVTDRPSLLRANRLGQVGRTAQDVLGTLDEGLEFAQGTSSYVWLGSRLIQGWAIELVLIACLLPFLATTVDLFARCRRRRIPLAPALRSHRSRLLFWAWAAVVFEVFALVGAWPEGSPRPLSPRSSVAHDWPAGALLGFAVLVLLGWLVARDRLIPRRVVTAEEVLAGHTAALLSLGALSLLVVAVNPFALIFLLPPLHAWLWLPQLRAAHPLARFGVLALGFTGPLLLLGSLAVRYDLGWDALWYLVTLRSVGYVSFVVIPLLVIWLAAAAQLATLTAGRYAPYPEASALPPRGPLRRAVRSVVLARRNRRRRAAAGGLEAVEQ